MARKTPQERPKVRGVFEKVKGSDQWWIEYYDRGERHREYIGSWSLACRMVEQRRTEVRQRKFNPNVLGRQLTVDDLLQRFASHFAELRSPAQHLRHQRRWSDWCGSRTANELKPGDIRAFQRNQKTKLNLAPATINREVAYLSKVFNLAIEDELVTSNPCKPVKKLTENNERIRWFTRSELDRLYEQMDPGDAEIVELLVLTGLRRGEMFGLLREHVDLVNGWLRIPISKHGRARNVPLTDKARAILSARLARHDHKFVLESRNPDAPKSGPNWYRRVYTPALRRANIKGATLHTTRHTYCSWLVMSGVPLTTVMEMAGHRNINTTRRYAHLAPDYQHSQAAVLDRWTDPGQKAPGLFASLDWLQRKLSPLPWVASFGGCFGGCYEAPRDSTRPQIQPPQQPPVKRTSGQKKRGPL